ncbi:SMI1/KNR4 family protein [Fulvivirga sediminis]|uniref:SMI1/KNR4 family protein n=1 Tax=Fulvivirga sediminis TaxID=2803949 RepID=A0A937K0X5_9BACT|nr:SMI1/KNR4 family protein [Fulvivirga sediminis]MBL3658044.1 SMI1/KNR4 family protein [Fulvivirga sediminis]
MNTIPEKYIEGLKKAYLENNGREQWEYFENVIHGADFAVIDQLKQIYPDVPEALVDLLKYVDGTYWRKYGDAEITFFFLGSDLYEYPYYLLSAQQMIENKHMAAENYSDYIAREYEEVEIDDKITNNTKDIKWLHFSDCMNNGGTSQLFIDFSPSETGEKGQVVRFLHDPDEFKVIASSFDQYLQKVIDQGYNFINVDLMA